MKIWCEKCDDFPKGLCAYCGGNGYTDPPQQILDDLECAEIERELLKQACRLDVYLENYSEIEVQISLWFEVNMDKYFSGKTKLEALRKAKEWLSGDKNEKL